MPAITKIGVYYDGTFFQRASDYYRFRHARQAFLDFVGLHGYIRYHIAQAEDTDLRFVQVIDSHYFRGRRSAKEASLIYERNLDLVLLHAGISTHYLPLTTRNGVPAEKGIDVWLALEAFESAILKRYDVLVVVTGDRDYVPLVRKVAVAGCRSMVVGFNFKYEVDGQTFETRTSQRLLDVCAYPLVLSDLIDQHDVGDSAVIDGLFKQQFPANGGLGSESRVSNQRAEFEPSAPSDKAEEDSTGDDAVLHHGYIKVVKEGYGFIVPEAAGKDVFFHYRQLVNRSLNELVPHARVSYRLGFNDDGREMAIEVTVIT